MVLDGTCDIFAYQVLHLSAAKDQHHGLKPNYIEGENCDQQHMPLDKTAH